MSEPNPLHSANNLPKTHDEIGLLWRIVVNQEVTYARDWSPEQKAFLAGIRATVCWALGMPSGGRKVNELMSGLPLFGIVNPLVGSQGLDRSIRGE